MKGRLDTSTLNWYVAQLHFVLFFFLHALLIKLGSSAALFIQTTDSLLLSSAFEKVVCSGSVCQVTLPKTALCCI